MLFVSTPSTVPVCIPTHSCCVCVCVCVCVPGPGPLWSSLRARWDRSSGICRYCILYFERSAGRWRCREGQACRSLWARLHSIQHVFSSLTNPPRPLRLRWHTRRRSVALSDLGYKVTDRSKRFWRCGVCLAFEFIPLRVSLPRYRFTISVASVWLFFIGRDGRLCATLSISLPTAPKISTCMTVRSLSLSCFLPFDPKTTHLYLC